MQHTLAAVVLALATTGCIAFEVRGVDGVVVREIQIARHTETLVGVDGLDLYRCDHVISPGLVGGLLAGAALGGLVAGPAGAGVGAGLGAAGEVAEAFAPPEQRDYCLQPWAVEGGAIPPHRRMSAPIPQGRPPRMPVEARSRVAPTYDPLDLAMGDLRAEAGLPLPYGGQTRAAMADPATTIAPAPPPPGLRLAAARVIDGDTLEAEILFPAPEIGITVHAVRQVRLGGYDAPDLGGKCAAERTLASDAAGRLAALVAGARELQVVGWDPAGDRYGRPVGRLYVDGHEAMAVLAAEGLARPYGGHGPRGSWCATQPASTTTAEARR